MTPDELTTKRRTAAAKAVATRRARLAGQEPAPLGSVTTRPPPKHQQGAASWQQTGSVDSLFHLIGTSASKTWCGGTKVDRSSGRFVPDYSLAGDPHTICPRCLSADQPAAHELLRLIAWREVVLEGCTTCGVLVGCGHDPREFLISVDHAAPEPLDVAGFVMFNAEAEAIDLWQIARLGTMGRGDESYFGGGSTGPLLKIKRVA